MAYFDSRAFNIPKEEVCNYFVWRQQDWVRNSIQMLAQHHFSHKQLHGKNQADMHEMLHEVGVNWADLLPILKNGRTFIKGDEDFQYVELIFTKNRELIEELLKPIEE